MIGSSENILKNLKQENIFPVKGDPWRMALVDDDLWISDLKTYIQIFNKDGTFVNIIRLETIKDIVQVNSTEVLARANDRVFVLGINGEVKDQVTDSGEESSSDEEESISDDEADSRDRNKAIFRSGHMNSVYKIMTHEKYINTGSVYIKNEVIYTESKVKGWIHKFSIDDELLEKFFNKNHSGKILRVCGSDKRGSVICCTQKSHGIHILTSAGACHTYFPVGGLGRERNVCISGRRVYVLHGYAGRCRISVFKIKNRSR